MRTIFSVILAVMLFAPRETDASELSFLICCDGDWGFSFGLESFLADGQITALDVDGAEFPYSGFEGSFDLVSGPLLNLTVSSDPFGGDFSVYTYGPGIVSIDAQWDAPDGQSILTGSFAGTLLGLTISVCEQCDTTFPGYSQGEVTADLGTGLFDPVFSHALGISGPSSGGLFSFGPDGIDGDPTSRTRTGGSHTGAADLTVSATAIPVPEPSMMALAIAGVGALSARRRRVRKGLF